MTFVQTVVGLFILSLGVSIHSVIGNLIAMEGLIVVNLAFAIRKKTSLNHL